MSRQAENSLCAVALMLLASIASGQVVKGSTPAQPTTTAKPHKAGGEIPPICNSRTRKAGGQGVVRPNCSTATKGIVSPRDSAAGSHKAGGQGVVRPNCSTATKGIVSPRSKIAGAHPAGGQGVVTPNCARLRKAGGQGIVRPNCSVANSAAVKNRKSATKGAQAPQVAVPK